MAIFQLLCSVHIDSSESFLRKGERPSLTVQSAGDAMHVFVNGQLSGLILNSFSNNKIQIYFYDSYLMRRY